MYNLCCLRHNKADVNSSYLLYILADRMNSTATLIYWVGAVYALSYTHITWVGAVITCVGAVYGFFFFLKT